uniref:hypothetical protein n=1 Tax=Campylobacter showae TaxID=204 RepID=UPI0026EBB1C2
QKLIFDAITQSNEYKYQWKGDFAVNSEKKRNVKIKPLLINNDGVYAEVIKEGNLTITDDDTPVNINVEGNGTQEAAEKMKGSVSLSRDLKNGEYVSFWINGQKKTFRGKKIRGYQNHSIEFRDNVTFLIGIKIVNFIITYTISVQTLRLKSLKKAVNL